MDIRISQKGQGAPEFNTVIAMVMLVFLIILIIVYQKQDDSLKLQKFLDAQKVTQSVADNINMMSRNGDGYYRYFSIPKYLQGYTDYNLSVADNFLEITYAGETWSAGLLTSNVSIIRMRKGDNETNCVSNAGGEIIINVTCAT